VVTEKTPQHFAGENSVSSKDTKLEVSDAHRQGHLSVNTKTWKNLHIDLILWLNIKNQNPYVSILLSLYHFNRKTSHPVPREGETIHSSKTLLPPTLHCFTKHIIVVERQRDHTCNAFCNALGYMYTRIIHGSLQLLIAEIHLLLR
jgi:hypothetical protein